MDYLDFELEIEPGQGREYPVAVIRSPAGEARETMCFPFDELALKNHLLALENALLRSGVGRRQVLSPDEQTVQNFGKDLFNALVAGEVRSRFDVSRREARQQGKGLRLKLRFLSPEMAALPWEFLYDHRRGEYLCLSKNTPTIRYLELPQFIPSLTVTRPLRILGMIASPDDLPQLDVARERQRIENAIYDLQEKGFLDLTWLTGQTWRDLMRAMRRGPWHIFHFTGHGGFDPHNDEGLIALADDQGKKHLLPASQLASLLADHYPLRLVLLNSCEGGRGSEIDIYSSTAAILVRRGIAAVLAMQHEITDRAAIEFARVFYEALADGLPVDTAATDARIAVNIAVNNSLEWGTPVLYMRSPDGVLFELTSKPPPREVIKGRLWVATEPQNATVNFLNIRANFSQGMELEPGNYELEVSAEGHEIKKELIELGPGEEKHLAIRLTKIKAHLWVESEPPDATVKILNLEAEFVQGMELKPGRYEIEVSADGYETKREWIELRAGEDSHIRSKLSKTKHGESELPEQKRRSRAMLIGVPAGLALILLIVMLLLFLSKRPTTVTAPPKPPGPPVSTMAKTIGMEFVLIPAGTFQMGSDKSKEETAEMYGGQASDFRSEHPQHQVTISRPFYLQTTEVTQGQWHEVMGNNPSDFKECGKDCPVENVSWDKAQEFIQKLNWIEKTDKYRLPTEAEWEYACRAGKQRTWCLGDDETDLGKYAWYEENSQGKPHPVGQRKPNAWGLYDMHGNVWEWTQDRDGKYSTKPVTDPSGSPSGENRVLRGGSYYNTARGTRSAHRNFIRPDLTKSYGYGGFGFRVAKDL